MKWRLLAVLSTIIMIGCRTQKHGFQSQVEDNNSNEQLSDIQIQLDTLSSIENNSRYKPVKKTSIDTIRNNYEQAFIELKSMLLGYQKLDFKRAVFITENAYLDDTLDYDLFINNILFYTRICEKLYDNNQLKNYPYSDSVNLKKNFAIYTVLKDTTVINGINFLPLQYDFENFSGNSEWSTTFVTHLLKYSKGNCHSLPYLYKIIANETNTETYLSLAPNHLYLKNRSKRLGWYNTELTSGQFPSDAWVKASGYVTLESIRNGIYMDTLSQNQSVALCVYDLAMGYLKKTNRITDEFIIKCCDLVLKYHPQNINAMILKAETLKQRYDYSIKMGDSITANTSFTQMKELYVLGVQLGYREMPKDMYLAWLNSSIAEQNKFQNKALNETLNQYSK